MDNKIRTIPRFPYNHTFTYMILGSSARAPEAVYSSGRIMNVSSGGLRMRTNGAKFSEGTVLLVRIPLAGRSASVPSLAQVKWIQEGKAGTYDAGLGFVVQ